jgi:hypothetical protein
MKKRSLVSGILAFAVVACLLAAPVLAQKDPLPSWNDGAAKQGWIVVSMKNDWKRIFAFEK